MAADFTAIVHCIILYLHCKYDLTEVFSTIYIIISAVFLRPSVSVSQPSVIIDREKINPKTLINRSKILWTWTFIKTLLDENNNFFLHLLSTEEWMCELLLLIIMIKTFKGVYLFTSHSINGKVHAHFCTIK